LPVDRLAQIRSAECTACLACVAACPSDNALQFALPPRTAQTAAERWRRRRLSPVALAVAIAALFLGSVLAARLSGHWQTNLPAALYQELIPQSGSLSPPAY
jgi:ferredoxin